MINEQLQDAIVTADMTIDIIAQMVGVDTKTVLRWVKGRVPHPGHRKIVAKILNVREDIIWPVDKTRLVRVPTHTSEVVAAYAHRANVPSSIWWHLFLKAQRHIDLLGNAMLFIPEQNPGLVTLLKEKCHLSCKIRLAIADPTSIYIQDRDKEERLGGTLPDRIRTTLYHFRDILDYSGIEIRYHRTPLYNSLFRFDDEMLVTPHLYGLHGSKAPLYHHRRLEEDGIFANYLSHFEAVWATTVSLDSVKQGH
jgi:hypothetical protein